MPNCVMKGCKNNTTKTKKQDGITFHTFPIRNENVKKKWVEFIRVSRNELSWNPSARSVICSTHFNTDDFYYTKNGRRYVLRHGYPKHVLVTPIDPIDVDPIQPHISQYHVVDTQIEPIEANSIQPHTSQSPISVIPAFPMTLPPDIEEESESMFDTHKTNKLRQRIVRLTKQKGQMKKKIKNLNQEVRRLKERNKSLKDIIDNLRKTNQ